MHKSILGLALAATMAVPASAASTMPLHQFVARGSALEKKGPLALFSKGEIRALQTEMAAAGKQVREERLAAEKAGRKGAFCPPPGGGGLRMSPQQVLRELRPIAASLPKTATVADGMRVMLANHYPCS